MEGGSTGSSIHLLVRNEVESGDDTVVNTGTIDANARAITVSVDAAITGKGYSSANSNSSSEATAISIDAGDGADNVRTSNQLTATSFANTDAIAASVVAKAGLATTWSGSTQGARR